MAVVVLVVVTVDPPLPTTRYAPATVANMPTMKEMRAVRGAPAPVGFANAYITARRKPMTAKVIGTSF